MKTSESFRLSAVLSFSGGLQDAYTYNVRGNVFANAQTGNVVLMSQNFMLGNVAAALSYMVPLLAFAAGILVAERIESHFENRHWRHMILILEILSLLAVGFIGRKFDMIANMIVSFSCAMQVQTFRKVHGYGYASTMCIGNLRSGIESISQYAREKDRQFLRKSLHFFGIIFIFAIGAGVGGILSGVWGIRTICISVLLLLTVVIIMRE